MSQITGLGQFGDADSATPFRRWAVSATADSAIGRFGDEDDSAMGQFGDAVSATVISQFLFVRG